MERNDRFPVLSKLSNVAKAAGWGLIGIGLICVLIGTIGFIKGVASGGERSRVDIWSGSVSRSGSNPIKGAATLAGGVVGAVSGLILLIYAEGAGVLIAIEGNTRGSAEYVDSEASNMKLGDVQAAAAQIDGEADESDRPMPPRGRIGRA